jgi:hypothetical protein
MLKICGSNTEDEVELQKRQRTLDVATDSHRTVPGHSALRGQSGSVSAVTTGRPITKLS